MPSALLEQHFNLFGEAETERLGQRFAQALTTLYYSDHFTGFHVHLQGELGTGKTAWVRAILLALGVRGRIRSPTYALVEHYAVQLSNPVSKIPGILNIHHFDLYRFTHPMEWIEAGFREYLAARALCLIEWPERAEDLMNTPDLAITFKIIQDGGRLLTARAFSQTGQTMLAYCL